MSPEQYEGIITFKSDIWSFGCVMLELITGKRPYDGIKMESFVSNSENPLDYFFENHKFEKNKITPDLLLLLQKCFVHNHNSRPSSLELLKLNIF